MNPLRLLREARGLSQRRLAKTAGVAFRTLQLLESGRHDPRWSTVVKLAKALDLPPDEMTGTLSQKPRPQETIRDCSRLILRNGPQSWKIHLMDLVDDWRRDPDPERLNDAPDPRVGPRLLALLASTASALCAEFGQTAPWWCAGVCALAAPWFVSHAENLKASALIESPAQFRSRNIFTLGNFLERT